MAYSTRISNQKEEKKSTRYYSNRQEKQVAKKNKGEQTINSGAAVFNAGDVKTNRFVIECKTTTAPKQSIGIKKNWIEKVQEEAFAMGREHWALAFDFEPDAKEQYYIISEKAFKLLNQYLEMEYEIKYE